jgi:serine/threonine protein kinase
MQLADFGVSRLLVDTGQTFTGTPLFMSPEVLCGKPHQLNSDIYGLGCVMYAMCMGMPPHDSEDLEGLKVCKMPPYIVVVHLCRSMI